jgi:hypothetical protein
MLQVKTKKYEKHKNKTYTHKELLIVHYFFFFFFSNTNEQVEEKKQGPQRGVHATLNLTVM